MVDAVNTKHISERIDQLFIVSVDSQRNEHFVFPVTMLERRKRM